jgi:Cu/Zn superoxide dismutase
MRRDRSRVSPLRLALVAVAAGSLVAACSTSRTAATSSNVEVTPPVPAGMTASLRSLQSGVSGRIRVLNRGDGATVLISMINLPPGQYRVALHATPNCSSPNGFSAGPAWAPPAAGKDARELMPIFNTNKDGTAEASVHVRGLRANGPDGVEGHSVVVYSGTRVTDAVPDVPNNRIACGVFQPSTTLSF